MKTANRKQECEKERGQNIFGANSPFRLMTGMTNAMQKYGENPGLYIVTNIWMQNTKLTTGVTQDREQKKSRSYMRE